MRLILGKPYLRRVGRRCIFQIGRLCSLQNTGLKPYACRIFPFLVRTCEKKNRKEAEFWYKDRDFYVYVNTGCREVKIGEPDPWLINVMIPEAIELYLNRKRKVMWLTSNITMQGPHSAYGIV